ncbi:hypothetical protein [Flavobacterium pectinovorum]|uniref:Uncharacterized protein n=1 Tax=Flavobacterium pectinovorum TaxID=29533 RepID=A0A502EY51_9FLAO|nr:hypothetical protein [Flavobacterium pectinovorum]TPG41510.1 hypothetical protein EAH81_08445 [Flavobacterium pectinovorum]
MKIRLLLLLILSSFIVNSQSKIQELYEYKVNDHLIKKDENLQFWLDSLTYKINYVGNNYSQSFHHEQSFTTFNLITKDTLLIKIPKTPLKLSFKTIQKSNRGKSSQPLIVEYNIPFYSKSTNAFDPTTFQYKAFDYFRLGLEILRINERELIANTLNRMIDDNYKSKTSKFDILINDINKNKKYNIPLIKEKDQNIQEVIRELNKVTKDIPKLIYDVYIYDKKGEEKTWSNVQEFYNAISDNIKTYLDNYINDWLVIKLERPELILFPTNWIKQKSNAESKNSTQNALYFDRVLFVKNQFGHFFEITFELTNTEQVEWCYGLEEHYNALKGKKTTLKASLENPISIRPEKIKIFVYPNKIRGILIGNQYEEIELFNSKLSFK